MNTADFCVSEFMTAVATKWPKPSRYAEPCEPLIFAKFWGERASQLARSLHERPRTLRRPDFWPLGASSRFRELRTTLFCREIAKGPSLGSVRAAYEGCLAVWEAPRAVWEAPAPSGKRPAPSGKLRRRLGSSIGHAGWRRAALILAGDMSVPDTTSRLYRALVAKGLQVPKALLGAHGTNLAANKRSDQILHLPALAERFTERAGVGTSFAG